MFADLRPKSVLTVGCAYGDELAVLLRGMALSQMSVTAVDLANTARALYCFGYAQVLCPRFTFQRLDLLRAWHLSGYGRFDVVQCGFVLHDIPYPMKDHAVAIIAKSVAPGGYAVLSDFFSVRNVDIETSLRHIYDGFIFEGKAALGHGRLKSDEWDLLAGDGTQPGLLRCRRQAMAGGRDYVDDLRTFAGRLRQAGLQMCHITLNMASSQLAVILARRPVARRLERKVL
jgi:SAM-dependent methyltransferase